MTVQLSSRFRVYADLVDESERLFGIGLPARLPVGGVGGEGRKGQGESEEQGQKDGEDRLSHGVWFHRETLLVLR